MNLRACRRMAAFAATSLCVLAASPAAWAATASVRTVTFNGTTQLDFDSATSFVQNDGGTVAAFQFAASPTCYGAACALDGPAVSVVLPPTHGFAEAMLSYSVSVVGGPGPVPILLSGLYSVVNPPELPDGAGGTTAAATADVFRSSGENAFHFLSSCLNYSYYLNESDPPVNCGSGAFGGGFAIDGGTAFTVRLRAAAGEVFSDPAAALASAYIDPYLQIDPAWAASHPGYSLAFEAGVGNGPPNVAVPSPVPEPETLALLGLGLAAVAWRRRRRAGGR